MIINSWIRTLFIFLIAFTLVVLVAPRINGYLAAKIDPDAVFPDNSRYKGEFKNGLLHGKGNLVGADGFHYTGDFIKGLYHGHGELLYNTGESYVGAFYQGLEHGQGILTTTDTLRYEGEFTHGFITGTGKLSLHDGSIYEGEVVNWLYHGSGQLTNATGNVFTGQFVKGAFTGKGSYVATTGDKYQGHFKEWVLNGKGSFKGSDGARYTGHFKNYQYHGEGELTSANGDLYVGNFEQGLKHGAGLLTFAKPSNGIAQYEGNWSYGSFVDPDQKTREKRERELAEESLYNQQSKLTAELSSLEAGLPGEIEMFFLGLGGDGSQRVFKRELGFVYNKVDEIFNIGKRHIMLLNTLYPDELPLATGYAFQQALARVAEQMNTNEDILFLYLTSHGTKQHSIYINQPGISLENLSLQTIQQSLQASGIKWKIIAVSACYSGGYIDALKDSHTLVLTAAAKDKQSFGCSDDSELTYFAKALFRDALTDTNTFEEAFHTAQSLIKQWEKTEEIDQSSDPQIAMGASIKKYLLQYRQALKTAKGIVTSH
ncbi:MAG: caspase family protein [Gammaproteobacteria bacterium]|nr:caspase family protein [Gammaproteobacteria bacterium]